MGRGVSFPGNIEVATVATQKFVIGIALPQKPRLNEVFGLLLRFDLLVQAGAHVHPHSKEKKSTFKRHEGVVIVSVKA